MATHGGATTLGRRLKFFKVLLPGSFEVSLRIPPKFAAGLGVCRPWRAAATLRDPTGRSWDVDLHRDGDHRTSFEGRGWRGFVSANGISAGHLLVFEHSGGLDFGVDAFDASGCQSDVSRTRSEKNTADARMIGTSIACDDDGLGNKAIEDQHLAETTGTSGDMELGNGRRRPPPASARRTGNKRTKRWPSTGTIASCNEGEEDASAGRGWQPDDETLCRRIERPYQLRFLDLSKSFCDRVGWTASRDVELCAAGDEENQRRRWTVSVKVSAKGGMMCAGWAAFAQDSRLSLSDACVFVPLQGSDVIRVQVRRGGICTP
ncbi:putative B3 domain-containing protein Os04g0346900 [Phragmites australis]|uniref:putative B3 domain-containing protein Os04g0346900 n=1 Tax=Phragmites australis TaxID=29695 RepID=UPI002D76900D|nr:putative B3 domain-containing protein Os04g0346900 [Phragmites australis]